MSGSIWKFSDQIDDVDVEMLRRDFLTFREAMEYYGLNEKPIVRLAREAGSVYKIGKMVRIRRSIFEAYLSRHNTSAGGNISRLTITRSRCFKERRT